MRALKLAALLTAFLFSPSAFCIQRIPVVLNHTGDGLLGERLSYEMREAIQRSVTMRVISISSADPRIVVNVTTTEGYGVMAVAMTVAYDSSAIAFRGYHLDSMVMLCGMNKVEQCAKSLVATVSRILEDMRSRHSGWWELLVHRAPSM